MSVSDTSCSHYRQRRLEGKSSGTFVLGPTRILGLCSKYLLKTFIFFTHNSCHRFSNLELMKKYKMILFWVPQNYWPVLLIVARSDDYSVQINNNKKIKNVIIYLTNNSYCLARLPIRCYSTTNMIGGSIMVCAITFVEHSW